MHGLIHAVLVFALQSGSMEELIRGFSEEDVKLRQKALDGVLVRWRIWTDADLGQLERSLESGDSEVRNKAKDCLETIRFNRGIPKEVWKAFPQVGPILRQGSPDEVADFFNLLRAKWEKRELKTGDVLPLVMVSIDDERPTRRTEFTKGTVWHMPAGMPAQTLLQSAIPRFYYNTPPDVVRAWWRDNQSRPEREWYLPDLAATDPRHRGGAIQRLFALDDPTLHPRLFDGLRTIDEEYAFEMAVKDASRLPKETIIREFSPYLRDKRFRIRFVAAKLVAPFERRAAIDCLADPFEDPSPLEYKSVHVDGLRDIVEWLAGLKDDRAFGVLKDYVLKPGDYYPREDVLMQIGYAEDPRYDEVLIELFSDPDRNSGWQLWGHIRNARLCDKAGILLARRLKVEEGRFSWPEDMEERNRNLSEIWNLYRDRKGLPPLPFVAPGTAPVAPEKVAELLPDLLARDEKTRRRAHQELSRLGGGAWPHLKARIADARGPEKDRLQETALNFSNSLRRVEGNEEATEWLKRLRERLHDPFDADTFFKEIEPWFGNEGLASLHVEISRQAPAGGIAVRVELKRKDPKDGTPFEFSASSGGGGFTARFLKEVFDEAWAKFLAPLREDMKTRSGRAFKGSMEMTKAYTKKP